MDLNRSTIHWFTAPKQLGLNQAEARCWQLNSDLPYGWEKPKYLNCGLLPPRMHISRKLELRVEPSPEPCDSEMGCRHPKGCLNHLLNICTSYNFKNVFLWFLNFSTHLDWFLASLYFSSDLLSHFCVFSLWIKLLHCSVFKFTWFHHTSVEDYKFDSVLLFCISFLHVGFYRQIIHSC